MENHHSTLFGYLVAIISALCGGYIPAPAQFMSLVDSVNAASPDMAAFGVQCLQAAAFAIIGSAIKFAFDYLGRKREKNEGEGEE